MNRKTNHASRKKILLFISILAVVAVSGCISLGDLFGSGETKVEAPSDVMSFSDSTVIPNPPILTGDTFTTSFAMKNLDEFEDAKNVKVELYDWGACTPSSCSPSSWGIDGKKTSYSVAFNDIFPKDVQQIECQFKSPSSEKIGGMPARCPIRYKLTYDFSGITTTDLNVISNRKFQELSRAGQTPTVTSVQSKSRGPIKVDFSFGVNQPVRTSTTGNAVKIPMYIRVENKGSGKIAGASPSSTQTAFLKSSMLPFTSIFSFITLAEAAEEKEIGIQKAKVEYTGYGYIPDIIAETETVIYFSVSGLEDKTNAKVFVKVIDNKNNVDCDLDTEYDTFVENDVETLTSNNLFEYFHNNFCDKAKNFKVIVNYDNFDREKTFYIDCSGADINNKDLWQDCIVKDTPPAGTSTFDYTISTSPLSGSVTQGGSTTTTIAAKLNSGAAESVAFSCSSGLPSGAACKFYPDGTTLSSGASSTLTVSTSSTTPAGTYAITISSGSSSGLKKTTTFTLTVNPSGTTPPQPPAQQAIQQTVSPISLKINVPKELVEDCTELTCDGYFSGELKDDKCVLTLKPNKKVDFVKDKSQVFRCELTSTDEDKYKLEHNNQNFEQKTYSIQSNVSYTYQLDNDFSVSIKPMTIG